MIRVFGQTDKTFTSNGDVVLKPLKARVHKKDNGDYYLELETGLEYIDYLTEGNIVVANTPTGDQAFRINNITKSKNKVVSKCFHVFYDSKNYLIADCSFENKTCSEALTLLNSATEPQSEFSVSSNVEGTNSYECIRKSLYNATQDIISLYGGHLVRDNFSFEIKANIGTDNGIVIQYRKNLKDITCKENWSGVCTKILPVGKDAILLNALDPSESIYMESQTQYDLPYCKTVTFQQDINLEDYESEVAYQTALIADLRVQAQKYLDENCLPQVNYTLKANLDRVTDIGDTIEVIDERLGIHLMTHVIGFVYDCIFGQYTEVEFGNFAESLNGLVSNMTNTAKEISKEASLEVQDRIFETISDYIKTTSTQSGWITRKYLSGVVEAWKTVSIDSADITWSAFLTSLKSGQIDVDYPFEIQNAVIEATMDDSSDISWISKAKADSSNEKAVLQIIRESNTGTLTVHICVRGTEA